VARLCRTVNVLATAAFGGCAALGLVGCDPYAVPREPDKADVQIEVRADERVETVCDSSGGVPDG
jgi:hypothetical protein